MSSTGESPAILFVEDEPDDVFFFRRAARKVGLAERLQVAKDGEEAVAYLEGQGQYQDRTLFPLPKLLILDLKLPKKSGLEVLSWLRKEPRFKDLPVIILTSSKEPSDIARARELGVVAYHVKPVNFRGLTAVVMSISASWITLTKGTGITSGSR